MVEISLKGRNRVDSIWGIRIIRVLGQGGAGEFCEDHHLSVHGHPVDRWS